MDIGNIFVFGRDDIPPPAKRRGNPFWQFMTPLLWLQDDTVDNEGASPAIATIRAYEALRADANKPPGPVAAATAVNRDRGCINASSCGLIFTRNK